MEESTPSRDFRMLLTLQDKLIQVNYLLEAILSHIHILTRQVVQVAILKISQLPDSTFLAHL